LRVALMRLIFRSRGEEPWWVRDAGAVGPGLGHSERPGKAKGGGNI